MKRLPSGASPAAAAAKGPESSATRSLRRLPERGGGARELHVPRVEGAHRGAVLDRQELGVALPERRLQLARGGGVLRVERGGEGVEVGAPARRAALDQKQALGHEDEDLGAPAQFVLRGDLDAVPARALALPGRVGDLDGLRACGRAVELQLHAREARSPGDELLLAARARRAAAEREPGALEQVGLAGGVLPDHDVEPGAEAHRRVTVGAEVDEPQAGDEHTRYSSPPTATTSPGCRVRPRRVSTSPFTLTSPSCTSSFACPPVDAAPASLRNEPSGSGPLTMTSFSCSSG